MPGTPAGGSGTADAIAYAAVYLASDEAAFVHGTVIDVDVATTAAGWASPSLPAVEPAVERVVAFAVLAIKRQLAPTPDMATDAATTQISAPLVQALEAILQAHAAGRPGSMVEVNGPSGGLVLRSPGRAEPAVLYPGKV